MMLNYQWMQNSAKARRVTLLAGASLVVLTASISLHSPQASAACLPFAGPSHTVTGSPGCLKILAGDFVINDQGIVSSAGSAPALEWSASNASIVNDGTIGGNAITFGGSGETYNVMTNGGLITNLDNNNYMGIFASVLNGNPGAQAYVISNNSTIQTINNSGLIDVAAYSDYSSGIVLSAINNTNGSTIDTINNSGTILAIFTNPSGTNEYVGVKNVGSITSINNTIGGTITGGMGINTSGTIDNIQNSGLISGVNAAIQIDATGHIGTIAVTGGTISGNIINNSNNILNLTGGTGSASGLITTYNNNGSIQDSKITSHAGIILSSGNLIIDNDIDVGTGSFSNTGGNLFLQNQISISGSYSQHTVGTLSFVKNLTTGSLGRLDVSEAVNLMGGNIALNFDSNSTSTIGTTTLVSAGNGSSYGGLNVTIAKPAQLDVTTSVSGNNLLLTANNFYIGTSVGSLTNTGAIDSDYAFYVANGGSVSEFNNYSNINSDYAFYVEAGGTVDSISSNGNVTGTTAALYIENGAKIGALTVGRYQLNGDIVNHSSNALTIRGGKDPSTISTLTGASGGLTEADKGLITSHTDLTFASNSDYHTATSSTDYTPTHLMLNSDINLSNGTVNAGTVLNDTSLYISNLISITGHYIQGNNASLQLNGGALQITGTADVQQGTINIDNSSGIYYAGVGNTLIGAAGGLNFDSSIINTSAVTGLDASISSTANAIILAANNHYVGRGIETFVATGNANSDYGLYIAADGSIGKLNNSGTIKGSISAIEIGSRTQGSIQHIGQLDTIQNSGLIAGDFSNPNSNILNIYGSNTNVAGTWTGSSGSLTAADKGTITNNNNVVFAGKNLLNMDVVATGHTISNTSNLQIVNDTTFTGDFVQTGQLAASNKSTLYVTGTANLANSTVIADVNHTDNYMIGELIQTIVSAGAGSDFTDVNAKVGGYALLDANTIVSGNNLILTAQNHYVGGTLHALTNLGTIGSPNYGLGVMGQLGTFTNSGLIESNYGIVLSGQNASIEQIINTGTINSGLIAIGANHISTDINVTNTGVIAGYIYSTSSQDINLAGGASSSEIGKFTGSSGGFNAQDIGAVINDSGNINLSGHMLMNNNITTDNGTVTADNAHVYLANNISVTGKYSQSGGAIYSQLQTNSAALNISGPVMLNGVTVYRTLDETGNYIAGNDISTIVAAGPGSSYRLITAANSLGTLLGNSTRVDGYNLIMTATSHYVGGTLGSLNNSGTISGETFGAAIKGQLGTLSNTGSMVQNEVSVGILSSGQVGLIANSGTIQSATAAIYSEANAQLGGVANYGLIAGDISVLGTQTLNLSGGTNRDTIGSYTGATGDFTAQDKGKINATGAGVGLFGHVLLNSDFDVGSNNVSANAATLYVNNPLNITGNFAQNGGAIVSGVNGTNYGSLIVSGDASVTDAQITISGSGLTAGQSFTVIDAAGTGTYTNNTAYMGVTNGLGATLSDSGNDLIVTLTSGNTENTYHAKGQAAGGTARYLGASLDDIRNSNGQQQQTFASDVLDLLDALPPDQQGGAIKQLSPMQTPPSQMARAGATTSSYAVDQQMQLSMGYDPVTGMAAGSEVGKSAIWGQALGGTAQRDSNKDADGFDLWNTGIATGLEHRFSDNVMAGAALSWVRVNSNGVDNSSGSSATLDSYQMTLYGTYRHDRAYINGQVSAGWNEFDQERSIKFLGTTADADYSGQHYMAQATVGYDLSVGNAIVTPLTSLRVLHTKTDSYTETGAGAANLHVDGISTTQVSQDLGVKVAFETETDFGKLRPEFQVAWIHDYNKGPITTSGLIGGQAFSVQVPQTSADGVRLGVAATLDSADNMSVRVEYEAELRNEYQSHTGMIKTLWGF